MDWEKKKKVIKSGGSLHSVGGSKETWEVGGGCQGCLLPASLPSPFHLHYIPD